MFDDENAAINPQKLPLYQKGQEIFEITTKIIDLIDEENVALAHLKTMMMEDAAMLTVKVAGAEAADLYDMRMENAAIIRKAARDLKVSCNSLEMYGFTEPQYLHLIREAIEEYRHLFIAWVNSFDPWNFVFDNWGLFNPPGVDDNNSKNDF